MTSEFENQQTQQNKRSRWMPMAHLAIVAAALYLGTAASCKAAAPQESSIAPSGNTQMPPVAPAFTPDDGAPELQGPYIEGDLSALELKLFANTFSDDTLENRLDRLERLVYGSRRSGSMEDRVNRLLRDVPLDPTQGTDLTKASAESSGAQASPFHASQSPTSLIEVVNDMEQEVFGKIYPEDPLVTRITRLEKSVFPSQPLQSLTPLPTRIHRLLRALQPAIQAQPSPEQNSLLQTPAASNFRPAYQDSTAPESSSSVTSGDNTPSKKGHPILHKLGKILSGVGTLAGETLGSMAVGSAMAYGPYGWGYPCYGGYGGYGMGPYYGCGYGVPWGMPL